MIKLRLKMILNSYKKEIKLFRMILKKNRNNKICNKWMEIMMILLDDVEEKTENLPLRNLKKKKTLKLLLLVLKMTLNHLRSKLMINTRNYH